MKNKRIPLRRCISCGEDKKKHELIRIVRNKDNEVNIDESGKMNGRGAYICLSDNCIDNVIKNNKLSKHLRTRVDEQIYIDLKDIIQDINIDS